MDLKEIQNLIRFVANSGVAEVKLEKGDLKLTIKRTPGISTTQDASVLHSLPIPHVNVTSQTLPQAQTTTVITEGNTSAAVENNNQIVIKSPMIGTFYRKAAPDKPNFVEVGKTISKGDVLCVIEAMKLFNEIEAEMSGKIVKILVEDMSPVEYDQPLFIIEP